MGIDILTDFFVYFFFDFGYYFIAKTTSVIEVETETFVSNITSGLMKGISKDVLKGFLK